MVPTAERNSQLRVPLAVVPWEITSRVIGSIGIALGWRKFRYSRSGVTGSDPAGTPTYRATGPSACMFWVYADSQRTYRRNSAWDRRCKLSGIYPSRYQSVMSGGLALFRHAPSSAAASANTLARQRRSSSLPGTAPSSSGSVVPSRRISRIGRAGQIGFDSWKRASQRSGRHSAVIQVRDDVRWKGVVDLEPRAGQPLSVPSQGLFIVTARPAHGEPVEPRARPSTGSGRADETDRPDFEKALVPSWNGCCGTRSVLAPEPVEKLLGSHSLQHIGKVA